MLKKIISVFLCITLCFGIFSVSASAVIGEGGVDDSWVILEKSNPSSDEMIRDIFSYTNTMAEKESALAVAATSWTGTASAIFGVVKNITSVISLVNGVVNLLKLFGVFKDHSPDFQISILEGIYSLQDSVEAIDKKVDRIQETLIDEFSLLDMKFAEQEYNHYKDEVWTNFYTNAVSPLTALQNEYTDEVNWLTVSRVEEWFTNEGSDVRVLYGNDKDGNKIQVYSGLNLGGIGKALPKKPAVSIEGIEVTDSITLPAEYISVNMNPSVNLSADNCIEVLRSALESGVYEAAENNELLASNDFYSEWKTFTSKEKSDVSKRIAEDIIGAVSFSSSYIAANEEKFASSVRSSYDYFCKWLTGSDNLTSPMYAQLKMLSLTHGFEGEITDEVNTIFLYLDLININFGSFAEMILSLSKAHTLENCEEIKTNFAVSSNRLYNTCRDFLTGNPNFCYIVNKPIQYKNVSLESKMDLTGIPTYDRKAKSSENWIIRDDSVEYSDDESVRAEQVQESGEDFAKYALTSKDLKLIYLMYESQLKRGLTDCTTFADYLINNNVIPSTSAEIYPYGLNTQIVTSYETATLNMNIGCYMNLSTPVSFMNTDEYLTPEIAEIFKPRKKAEFVKKGSIPKSFIGALDDIKYSDQAIGSTFSLLNGEVKENEELAARVADMHYDGVYDTYTYVWGYCDDVNFHHTDVGERVVYDTTVTLEKHYGAVVATDLSTYEFPKDTKEIRSNFFGNPVSFKKIILNGIPETIADDAFAGVGNENYPCYLEVPENIEIGDLTGKWHGGWFGDKIIKLHKNDGSGENYITAQPRNKLCSDIKCPYNAPDGMEFAGWGIISSSQTPDCGTSVVNDRKELYAVWKADHTHKYVTNDIEPTCEKSGTRGRRVCTICGYVGSGGAVVPASGHRIDNHFGDNVCSRCGQTVSIVRYDSFVVTGTDLDGVIAESTGSCKLTITQSGDYTIRNFDPFAEVSGIIIIEENLNVNLTLDGVNINGDSAALEIKDGENSNVKITLANGTENILKGLDGSAGLQKDSFTGTLTIDGNGTLKAYGGANAAGIGAGINMSTGQITINSGSIYAYGGTNGAGIGGGKNGGMQGLTINGGNIYAQGGSFYPAIGSDMPGMTGTGFDCGYNINSGVITAVAGDGCPNGIGIYYEGYFDSLTVKISPNASVDMTYDNESIYRYNGEKVLPYPINNPRGKTLIIDGNVYPYKYHFNDMWVYPYLTQGSHDVKYVNSVTVDKSIQNGVASVSRTNAGAGEIVNLIAQPDIGYELEGWIVSPYVPVYNNCITMPDYDITVTAIFRKSIHIIKWIADNTYSETSHIYGYDIKIPDAPEKEGYRFVNWTPSVPKTMPDEDLEFTAVYTPVNYIIKFVADGKVIKTDSYTLENETITPPEIPEKPGYIASWEDYTIKVGGITVNAKYVPEIYIAKFVADGEVIDEIPYTLETKSITPPVIPNKDGYTAKWNDYELTVGGITVNAVYTPVIHEHTFATKYSYNEYMHWYPSTCGHSDIAKGLGEHTFGDGIKAGSATIYICTECSYVKIVSNELEELKSKAIAELEAAAGTERSEAMNDALSLAKTAVERAVTEKEITSAKASGLAVIHASEFAIGNCTIDGKYVFGLEPLLTESEFNEKYIVNYSVSVDYSSIKQGVLGTGSTVNITYYNGYTDEYSVVIFGDVNGDGVYDGNDAFIVNCIVNGMLTKEQIGEAQYMAADCNHDGTVDNSDVELLTRAGLLLSKVNQSDSPELQLQYSELIDQSPVIIKKEEMSFLTKLIRIIKFLLSLVYKF